MSAVQVTRGHRWYDAWASAIAYPSPGRVIGQSIGLARPDRSSNEQSVAEVSYVKS
jgi:hypothetical protein